MAPHSSTRLRVAAIRFLNPAPLMWDFDHPPRAAALAARYAIHSTTPALCADQLLSGRADLGLIPIASLTPDLAIVPGCAIASLHRVRSIQLIVKLGRSGSQYSSLSATKDKTAVIPSEAQSAQSRDPRVSSLQARVPHSRSGESGSPASGPGSPGWVSASVGGVGSLAADDGMSENAPGAPFMRGPAESRNAHGWESKTLDGANLPFVDETLRRVRTVASDTASRSSLVYAQLLFRKFISHDPEFISTPADPVAMLASADAALLIGDPALLALEDRARIEAAAGPCLWLDLAHQWRARTGLPWVAAVWAVRPESLTRASLSPASLLADLTHSRDRGLAHIESLVAEWSARIALPPATIRHYLTRNIHYTLDADCIAAIAHLRALAAEASLLPPLPNLRFLE